MKISVVIPLYNKRDSIHRAIKSVLNQTELPDEIIIVNDGSTDGSEDIVKELQHPLIKFFDQENAGVSAARNKGIELAKSEWVAFLDADDFWEQEYLNTIHKLHKNFPTAKVLATNYRYQLHTGEYKKTQINKLNFGEKSQGVLDNYFQVAATSNPPIWSSAVVVLKERLLNIGGFPLGVKSGEDLITWARLAIADKIAYSTSPLVTFILDPAHSYEGKPNRIPQTPDVVGKTLKKIYAEYKAVTGLRSYIAHWHKMRASVYLRLGKRMKGFREIKKSLQHSFFQPKVWLFGVMLVLPTSIVHRVFRLK